MRLKSALSLMGTMWTLKWRVPSLISMSSEAPPLFLRKTSTDFRSPSLFMHSETLLPSTPPEAGKDLRKNGLA